MGWQASVAPAATHSSLTGVARHAVAHVGALLGNRFPPNIQSCLESIDSRDTHQVSIAPPGPPPLPPVANTQHGNWQRECGLLCAGCDAHTHQSPLRALPTAHCPRTHRDTVAWPSEPSSDGVLVTKSRPRKGVEPHVAVTPS